MHCQRDTLIKYLLDELYTYEGDHSDALNPFDSLSTNWRAGRGQSNVFFRATKPLGGAAGAK